MKSEPTSDGQSVPDWVCAVAANFTAEPVAPSLRFWLEKLGVSRATLRFAPYNQIFQSLMAPDSVFSGSGPGLNVVLVRFEDWGREQHADRKLATIGRSGREFIDAIRAFAPRAARPTIVAICPSSSAARADEEAASLLSTLETELCQATAALSALKVIVPADLAALYPVDEVEDPESDRQGHVPFTPSFWAALGTMVVRAGRTLFQLPFKVVVTDADNTLWGGVAGELGPGHVALEEPWLSVQRLLQRQQAAGMLLTLVSKNQEADVDGVFQRPQMLLTRRDFIGWKVNWRPKSANIQEIAAELNLGLDSFLFLDDNPAECAEVSAGCLGITALCLPGNPQGIPVFLEHVWAFDSAPITTADRNRTHQYFQQAERKRFRETVTSYREFIEGLGLKVDVTALSLEQLDRAAQLTQRTNQFNTTGHRKTAAEIRSELSAGRQEFSLVSVQDRFGDYGEVGLMACRGEADALCVEDFLLSCRVLGKGVEHRMLRHLGQRALELGKQHLLVAFRRSERNEPAVRFFESLVGATAGAAQWSIPASVAAGVEFNPAAGESAVPAGKSSANRPAAARRAGDFSEIAGTLARVPDILLAVRRQSSHRRPSLRVPYAAPRTPIESRLSEIWADVLGYDQVGIHDDYFDLGGDSILCIQIISRASRAGLQLTLRQHFQHPNIADLATVAVFAGSTPRPRGDEPALATAPLTPIQRWFFEKELPEPHHWNMELLLEASGPVDAGVLARALGELVAHHDALRFRFHAGASGWSQTIAEVEGASFFAVADLSTLGEVEQDARMRELAGLAHASLDLQNGPLLRARLFLRGAARPARLHLVLHHLVVDGISWRIFLEDLQSAYEALREGRSVQLPPATGSYFYWAQRIQHHANHDDALRAERDYWAVSTRQNLGPLPVDFPSERATGTEGTLRTVVVQLTETETHSLLAEVPKVYQTQINDVLLAALVSTFCRWSGNPAVRIDLEGHGRETLVPDLDHARTVGWFTSIFPVVLSASAGSDAGQLLRSIKEQIRRIPNRGIGFGLLRYLNEDPSIAEPLRQLPRPEVMFNYLGQFDQVLPSNGLFRMVPGGVPEAPLHGPKGRRSHLIEIIGSVSRGVLRMDWMFSTRVFAPSTIQRLGEDYLADLRHLMRHCLTTPLTEGAAEPFPLARLSQRSLNQVLARIGKSRK